jgi:NADH-quinone oxidoreductase subunit E
LIEQDVAKYPPGRQASAVISLLWRGQDQEGWVTKPMIEEVARILGMPFIRVLEVATFYTMFNLEPVGEHLVQVCTTTPCWLRGSDEVVAVCKKHISPHPHTVSDDGKFSWMEVECLGACVNAPMMQIGKDFYEDLNGWKTEAILESFRQGRPVKAGPQVDRHSSEPIGGATTLTDWSLYAGKRDNGERRGDVTGEAGPNTEMPGQGAGHRESPAQKPPGAAS